MTWALRASVFAVACLAAASAFARPPVVVEVYTAQGCVSCDASNAFAAGLADRAGVTALTFNVDYWDYLGWKDTFARPEFADRQRAYDKRFGLQDVYTPQIIVEGEGQASGDKQGDVEALIRAAKRAAARGPEITPRADGTIAVEDADRFHDRPRRADDVWLVRYDPRTFQVAIGRGENSGKTLPHRNIVRDLVRIGRWSGAAETLAVPPPADPAWKTAILVQAPKAGPIVAAAKD